MDSSNKNIEDFQLLLQKQSLKKPSFLYNKDLNPSEETFEPQDVIKTVSSQIKAYQLADSVKSAKSGCKDLTKGKKSNFLPLNKLPVYGSKMDEAPKENPHKFETQCVLDTQLMDIIDGAATMNANTGMTQEFDTTFSRNDVVNIENTKPCEEDRNYTETDTNDDEKHEVVSIFDKKSGIVIQSGQVKKEIDARLNEKKTEEDTKIDHDIAMFLDDSIDVNMEQNSQLARTATEDTVTFIDNLPITQEVNEETEVIINSLKEIDIDKTTCAIETDSGSDIDTGQDIERSPSPVLNIKAMKRKLKTQPPLVVSLETFENFENVAMSLVKDTDFITAKHLINSQILGKELCLNDDTDILLGIERDNSPILGFKSDELKINSNELISAKMDESVSIRYTKDITENPSEVLKDEILFSSDEEDFDQEESQILPPPCALEIYNNEKTDILEKNMFVGIQTASNKSIEISRNSYKQAQSILSNDDGKDVKELSLKELVEKCDNITNIAAKPKESCKTEAVELVSLVNEFEEIVRQKQGHKCIEITGTSINNSRNTDMTAPEKQCFTGLMTASNKKICMSDKALKRGQKVFKDIDLIENVYAVEIANNTDSAVEQKSCLNNTEEKTDNFTNTDDKINDELLLQEFENIEMSLEEKERDSNVKERLEFEGFKTADNKKITISKEAMTNSKNVFQDIDLELQNVEENDSEINKEVNAIKFVNRPSTSTTEFVGFKTANNQEIKISDEAFAKSKDVFKEIGKDKHKIKTIDDMISQPTTSNFNFAGFKTANNKDIRISNDALSKTKNIFKDIDKEQTRIDIPNDSNQPSTSKTMFNKDSSKDNNKLDPALSESEQILKDIAGENFICCEFDDPEPVFKGFGTESEAEVEISQQAIEKQRRLFKDITIDDDDSANMISDEIEPAFVGFKTANNKAVKISAEALEKSENIFADLDLIDPNEESRLFTDENDDEKLGFKGFQTASKKPVTVSANALAKSKRLFKDIDGVNDSTPEKIPKKSAEILENNKNIFLDPINSNDKTQHYEDKGEIFSFKGFQTASKKPVTVSADALAKSKMIFNDIDETNDALPEKIPKTANFNFKGFQINNKKPVDINQKVLIANEMLLNDLSNQTEDSRNKFVGFKTASNSKNVKISEEALAKSKKMLDDIEDLQITAKMPSNLEPIKEIFKGFQSANKTKVEVSKEALKKAKNLFDIKDFGKDDNEKSFAGFQTANNNKVTISEQALAKSRKMFQDVDTESDVYLPKNNSDKNTTEKGAKKHNFGLKTGPKQESAIPENFLLNSKKIIVEHIENDKKCVEERKTVLKTSKDLEIKDDIINIDLILNTQVVHDFEEDVCTEDFRDTSRPNKRSASPILLCPKAKKRKKFETPYKMNQKTVTDKEKDTEVSKQKNIITFRELYKKNKKYTLKDLTDFEKGENKTTDPYILNFTLENILDFEFDEDRNDFKEGKMTIEELKQIFTEGTDIKLIPDGWLDIHLKLILWKLISYETRFPNALGKVCTVKNVIEQLKYRYDKELYNSERSVLRKILEKDDAPNKTMVLCVAGIYVDGISVISATNLNNIELLLTDGWYFIKATIDNLLSKLVYDEKIVVGKKIVTCGAELVNCEQGVAPWEDTSAIRLSISGNSTRPARWHEKLGLRPSTMICRLASVRVGGGKVARLRASVVRVYPRLYVEKFQDGSTVTRSERLEHQYQMKYEAEREAMIEKIYEEVEKEMCDQESQDSDSISDPGSKRKCLDSGSQIAKQIKISRDPAEFRAQLTSSQSNLLQDHISKQRDRYLQAIQDRVQERLQPRNVVPLARGRVAGLERDGDNVTVTKGTLSIWKPNDELLDIFKEGSWIEVTNVVPTAFRNSEIQISAGRQSIFRSVKCKEDIFKPYLISLSRTCYSLKDLSQNPSMKTDYDEIDTVGMIFSIDPSNRDFDSNKNQFQNVYLADVDKNMIGVNFWGGIKKFGYENILDTGQVIYCGNLQKRAGNTRKNVAQFRATEFAIFTKTPKNDKGREMVEEMNKKLFGLDRRKLCEDCIAIKQNYSVIRCLNDSKNISPYRFNNSDYNLGRNKVFIETPVGVKGKNKVEDFNLTGLDFESTFRQPDTQLSPKTFERKKKVNERIAKLKMYGEPPSLSTINIINKSKNATNSYKSPLLKDESDTSKNASVNKLLGVVTPIKLPDDTVKTEDTERSPIVSNISMNRTYMKRNINPVKLSFGNTEQNVDKTIDNFEEEFEGSPPLSLE